MYRELVHANMHDWARHSPVPHTQISSSPGSPAACKRSPATLPGSAASWFPPGRPPVENTHTHGKDHSNRAQMQPGIWWNMLRWAQRLSGPSLVVARFKPLKIEQWSLNNRQRAGRGTLEGNM